MKDKLLQIRVDPDFLSKIEYLQAINGFSTIAETVRVTIEKEVRRNQTRPTGRWESSQGLVESGMTRCPNCKTEYYVSDLMEVGENSDDGLAQAKLPNFCPHCGAFILQD